MNFKATTILLFLLVILSLATKGQDITGITKSIQQSDSKAIAMHFSDNVDLKIPGTDGVFSKQQAELILRAFFEEGKVSNYELKHQGKSKNDSYYLIGSLTRTNQLYRTYILLKKNGDKHQILEFNVETDE
tara:strand:+ start:1301 stop:1693 length:393 start_codon:yes stop_codon:yes gene_type:complete